jgi:hypothetical protein
LRQRTNPIFRIAKRVSVAEMRALEGERRPARGRLVWGAKVESRLTFGAAHADISAMQAPQRRRVTGLAARTSRPSRGKTSSSPMKKATSPNEKSLLPLGNGLFLH